MEAAAVCPRLRESRTRSRQVRVNYIGEKRGGMLTFQEEESVPWEIVELFQLLGLV